LRVHGRPLGHAAHLRKLAEKDAKAKATRRKNGTVQVRKSLLIVDSYQFGVYMVVIAMADDGYDEF